MWGNSLQNILLFSPVSFRPHVTEKDETSRLNAITLLIDFALNISLKPLEVRLILEFLSGRLADRYNVIPKVLSGITSFVKAYEIDIETIK